MSVILRPRISKNSYAESFFGPRVSTAIGTTGPWIAQSISDISWWQPFLPPLLVCGLWQLKAQKLQKLFLNFSNFCNTIVGVSGKMSTESASDDDNLGTENCQLAILSVLGRERRDRVLAGLYMGRSDTALLVRQAALHVWKVVVAHTPKMLREIMSTLFQLLLGCLASQSYDKRQVTVAS